jgi:hypothetical protein
MSRSSRTILGGGEERGGLLGQLVHAIAFSAVGRAGNARRYSGAPRPRARPPAAAPACSARDLPVFEMGILFQNLQL